MATQTDLSVPRGGYLAQRLPWLPELLKQTRQFLKNPLSVTGLILILFFAAIAVSAPWLAPPDPNRAHEPLRMPRDGFSQTPKPPNPEAWKTFPPDWHLHPLGTIQGQ